MELACCRGHRKGWCRIASETVEIIAFYKRNLNGCAKRFFSENRTFRERGVLSSRAEACCQGLQFVLRCLSSRAEACCQGLQFVLRCLSSPARACCQNLQFVLRCLSSRARACCQGLQFVLRCLSSCCQGLLPPLTALAEMS